MSTDFYFALGCAGILSIPWFVSFFNSSSAGERHEAAKFSLAVDFMLLLMAGIIACFVKAIRV